MSAESEYESAITAVDDIVPPHVFMISAAASYIHRDVFS